MTTINAAIYGDGKGVILCADKTTSMGSFVIENTPKIIDIGTRASVLTSGFAQNYLFLEDFKDNAAKIEKIYPLAENCANAYKFFRLKKIQHEVLPKFGIAFLDEYFAKQKTMNEFLTGLISAQIEAFNLYVDMIIAGIDESAHIFYITNPGTFISYEAIGFCCMGSGGPAAVPVFEYYKYSKKMALEDVLRIIYFAKKRSEKLGGIGEETDIKIIDTNSMRAVEDEQLSSLESMYKAEIIKNPAFFG